MTRQSLIYKIIQALNENGALDVGNYSNQIEQLQDIHNIVEKELDGLVIIEGMVIE